MDFKNSSPVTRVSSPIYSPIESERRLSINILIIDTSDTTATAYQFSHDNDLGEIDLADLPLSPPKSGDLVSVGNVEAVKRRSHVAILQDGTLITYRHLIIIGTGRHQQRNDYFSALLALIDALRTNNKLKEPTDMIAFDTPQTRPHTTEKINTSSHIQKIFEKNHPIGPPIASNSSVGLHLYELQL